MNDAAGTKAKVVGEPCTGSGPLQVRDLRVEPETFALRGRGARPTATAVKSLLRGALLACRMLRSLGRHQTRRFRTFAPPAAHPRTGGSSHE
jgi:hypothetical protein